ncbi:hypothetical protein I7I48_11946 [Histoplasma ohiense]|nr:hypothetical protein I7I48_11946 [Histoplasma ohiense (nom. inval.)]
MPRLYTLTTFLSGASPFAEFVDDALFIKKIFLRHNILASGVPMVGQVVCSFCTDVCCRVWKLKFVRWAALIFTVLVCMALCP